MVPVVPTQDPSTEEARMPIVRHDTFALSRKPYLVPAGHEVRTSRPEGTAHGSARVSIDVMSVRRTRGVLGVHLGELWDHLPGDVPVTWDRLLAQYAGARYGPNPVARWTGASLWTPRPVTEDRRAELLGVLRPAFDHLVPLIEAGQPVTPVPGWDGWWVLTEPAPAHRGTP